MGSRNSLTAAHLAVGDLERATPLFEAALADTERVPGPDHPVTRAVRSHFEGTT
ncbi:tetratricopeptide repeat protein [Saccharothrix sp. NRRL B-16314]|uniref:tetratricopeptide repeat protein n=1 Tax=Saccharothrix sp. NRRL B-16314 TaxID=1463825 RepID=UPI0009E088E7